MGGGDPRDGADLLDDQDNIGASDGNHDQPSSESWATMVKKKSAKKERIAPRKVVGGNKNITSKIKPVKSLIRKFVFHLDNVSCDIDTNDIVSYVTDNKVEVINCFDAKSWIHFKTDSSESCKAFRVCVKLEDKNNIFNNSFWPEGVLVREWKFKSKKDNE